MLKPVQIEEESADSTIRRPLQDGAPSTRAPSNGNRPTFSGPFQDTEAPFTGARTGNSFGSPLAQAAPFQDSFASQTFAPHGLGSSNPLADLVSVLGPGPADRARADKLSPTARRADEFIDNAFDAAALNALVGVSSPLLWLAGRLNESAAPADLHLFRDRVVDEIRRFESAAMAKGLPNRSVLIARYALCATIDDIILNTSWAGQAQWATSSLVSSLYGETWGGERFFDLLQQLVAAPDDNIDLLELLAICLSVGFIGKYRVMEDGQSAFHRLRAELYRIIRRVRGSYERDLAPAWRGADIPFQATQSSAPFWMPMLGALLLLSAFYLVLRLNLEYRIDVANQRIAALVPRAQIAVPRPEIPPLPKPVRASPLTQVQRISAVLKHEIAERRVEVVGASTTVTIRLPTSSFASASATLPASDAAMVEHIATALNPEPGAILVTGYTDNVPPVPTAAIKSNIELSRARAASVAAMLKPYLSAPDRVSTTGLGDADPIASNATAEGRARNRRVDIQIPAEETLKGTRPAAAATTLPSAPTQP